MLRFRKPLLGGLIGTINPPVSDHKLLTGLSNVRSPLQEGFCAIADRKARQSGYSVEGK